MKEKGFIATSLLYSFFLVFCTLVISLLATFLHNRLLLAKLTNDIKDELSVIKSRTAADFKVGDYVEMDLYLAHLGKEPEKEKGYRYGISFVVAKQEASKTILVSQTDLFETYYYNTPTRIATLNADLALTENISVSSMNVEATYLRITDYNSFRTGNPLVVRRALLTSEAPSLIYNTSTNKFQLISECFTNKDCDEETCTDPCQIANIPPDPDPDPEVASIPYNLRIKVTINNTAKVQAGRGQIREPYVFVKD